jgi:N-acetylglucosaminyldiphosphoundecaprenol N-acetyl-beta-D-mannosaminyltransferase
LEHLFGKDANNIDAKSATVTFLNPYSYLIARKNLDCFEQFSHIFIDGILLLRFMKLAGFAVGERTSFDYTSIANAVFQSALSNKQSIFVVGSTDNHIKRFICHVNQKYPQLIVAGCHSGFFDGEDGRRLVIRNIANINPDIVLCGMGTPLQEYFLLDLAREGWSGIGYTCGGFIHQTATAGGHYYPDWINRYNLRSPYRAYTEPKLLKRYLLDYPLFLVLFLVDYITYLHQKCASRWSGRQ